jgi:hypothetical protein
MSARVAWRDLSAFKSSVLMLVALAAGTLSLGCRLRAEQTIKDTLGRAFQLNCESGKECAIRLAQESSKNADKPVFRLTSSGRIVGVCGSPAERAGHSPSACRPLVCTESSDCPKVSAAQQSLCSKGLCTEPNHSITSEDSVMLCLAETQVGENDASQMEKLALALNCGTPCKIPASCRQP